MADKSSAVRPYGLDRIFEKHVAYLACTNPEFYETIAREVDPEALRDEPARLLLRTARTVFVETGVSPSSKTIVMQRLRRWRDGGKVDDDQLIDAADMLTSVEDAGSMPHEEVTAQLVPVLRKRMLREAAKAAADIAAKTDGRDPDVAVPVADILERVGLLDSARAAAAAKTMDDDAFATVAVLNNLRRLPTGIDQLDAEIDGGMPCGCLGVFVGGPGEGKSMALSHMACSAFLHNLVVCYATLELSLPHTLARMFANVTGETIDSIVAGSPEAKRKFGQIGAKGNIHIQEFEPHATTAGEVLRWVDDTMRKSNRKVDLLVVDYADKLRSAAKAEEYLAMREVYEGLRRGVHKRDMWGFTASQSTRRQKTGGKKSKDVNDMADSMHKGRVADLVITLNLTEDEESAAQEVTYRVAKYRHGQGGKKVGPLPVDWAVGRMVP